MFDVQWLNMYTYFHLHTYCTCASKLDSQDDQGEVEGRMTRSGASLKSPEVNGQAKGKGKKRGRKRKAEESSYKISDFVDNQVKPLLCL